MLSFLPVVKRKESIKTNQELMSRLNSAAQYAMVHNIKTVGEKKSA